MTNPFSPTGNLTLHPALNEHGLVAWAEISEDGIGVTWQAFIAGAPLGFSCAGRCGETEAERHGAPGTDLISR